MRVRSSSPPDLGIYIGTTLSGKNRLRLSPMHSSRRRGGGGAASLRAASAALSRGYLAGSSLGARGSVFLSLPSSAGLALSARVSCTSCLVDGRTDLQCGPYANQTILPGSALLFWDLYLLTYLWRPQAGRHMVPPDFTISHQRSQLSRVPSTGVSA